MLKKGVFFLLSLRHQITNEEVNKHFSFTKKCLNTSNSLLYWDNQVPVLGICLKRVLLLHNLCYQYWDTHFLLNTSRNQPYCLCWDTLKNTLLYNSLLDSRSNTSWKIKADLNFSYRNTITIYLTLWTFKDGLYLEMNAKKYAQYRWPKSSQYQRTCLDPENACHLRTVASAH